MQFDQAIVFFLNSFAQSTFLSAGTVLFAEYFPYLVALLFVVFVLVPRENTTPPQSSPQLRGGGSRIRLLAEGVGSGIVARVFVEAIRLFVHRPRPFVDNHAVVAFLKETSYSFPSGHAAFFFALSTVVYMYSKRWGGWFFVASTFIGLARVAAGVHYPTDILGGAVLGVAVGWAVHRFFKKPTPSESPPYPPTDGSASGGEKGERQSRFLLF